MASVEKEKRDLLEALAEVKAAQRRLERFVAFTVISLVASVVVGLVYISSAKTSESFSDWAVSVLSGECRKERCETEPEPSPVWRNLLTEGNKGAVPFTLHERSPEQEKREREVARQRAVSGR